MRLNTLQAWLEWQENYHPRIIDLGLERVASVYRALLSNNDKPVTITVAGTNGKGSCIALLDAILSAAGFRVGSYTSPHIIHYNERIKLANEAVSDVQICHAFERIESVRGNASLSYFEFGTLAALDIFSRSALDVQLLEVGLGGRLDAVNIVYPEVAIITSICIDHCNWLGATREAIGQEKAGIYREDVPAIIGDPAPPNSLFQCAVAANVPLYCLGTQFNYQQNKSSWSWFADEVRLENLPQPALKGDHQYLNAATAIQALYAIKELLPVSEEAIKQGLSNVKLSGRLQYIAGDVPVLLDVAHNPLAAKKLADYLQQSFFDKKIHAVFSMMKDKDLPSVISAMNPVIADWYFAPLKNPRTASLEAIKDAFTTCDVAKVYTGFSDATETIATCKQNAKTGDLIVVFGSFFLVAEYLLNWQKVRCNA